MRSVSMTLAKWDVNTSTKELSVFTGLGGNSSLKSGRTIQIEKLSRTRRIILFSKKKKKKKKKKRITSIKKKQKRGGGKDIRGFI